MSNTSRRALIVALLTTLLAPTAWAAPPSPSADAPPALEQATFVVRIIEASRVGSPAVDARLGDMRHELRPFEGRYNQFTLIGEQVHTLAIDKIAQTTLPGKSLFTLQFLGFQSGKVRRVRYLASSAGARSTRSVAPGGRTLDAIPNGEKLTIVSTTVR